VWPAVRQRVVHVCCCEHACAGGDGRGGQPAMVAASIEPLVVGGSDRRSGSESRGAREDAIGMVGVQPHALPFAIGESTFLVPNRGENTHATQIVEMSSPRDGLRVADR